VGFGRFFPHLVGDLGGLAITVAADSVMFLPSFCSSASGAAMRPRSFARRCTSTWKGVSGRFASSLVSRASATWPRQRRQQRRARRAVGLGQRVVGEGRGRGAKAFGARACECDRLVVSGLQASQLREAQHVRGRFWACDRRMQ